MESNEFIRNPQLHGEDFYWQGNQTGFLLIHGFTATTAEVRLIAEKLREDGFTTAAPLLPGHGTHPDDLNQVNWQMWLEKVKETYEQLLDDCEHIYVIGESMGAVLALELAAQHPEIDGLLLFAPAINVRNLWLARLLAPFKKYLTKSDEDDGLAWKGYNVYPLKAAVEFLNMQRHARKILPQLHQRLTVFTGEFDQTIAENSADTVMTRISSYEKCHIHMKETDHCILLDRELDLAYHYVTAFIKYAESSLSGRKIQNLPDSSS